jgi:2-oxoisovalerate dehydrogenase E1 component
MGVYWASNAAKEFDNQIEIIDLRTLAPLDENRVFESVKKHNRCIVLTEEPVNNSFAQSLAARISENCFRHLDAPVKVVGAKIFLQFLSILNWRKKCCQTQKN